MSDDKWISVEEDTPKDGTDVLIVDDGCVGVGLYKKWLSSRDWYTYMSSDFWDYGGWTGAGVTHPEPTDGVTHWLPLPEPPETS